VLCLKIPLRRLTLDQRTLLAGLAGLGRAIVIPVIFIPAILGALLFPARAEAQEKVAEGEYHMRGAAQDSGSGKSAMDHWVLYTRKQGGYRLQSEVTSAAGTGAIVIQTEELDDQLSPISITVRLYTREDIKKPFSMLSCRLWTAEIGCKAGNEELILDDSIDQKSPILFAVTSLEHVDLMWMIAGAINRAHFEENKASVPTLVLRDSEDGPELVQTEIDALHADGPDPLEIRGAKVPARRYSFGNSGIKCWLAGSGLLLKMENKEGSIIELEKFKQYKKLVPELP
jgi:hypothetical protein